MTPTTEPSDSSSGSAALTAFEEACSKGVKAKLEGQLDYPKVLILKYKGSVTYNAGIDLSDASVPPDQVIDVGQGTAASERVMASCKVQAKLEAVDDQIKIEGGDDSDWTQYDFSPTGSIEWAWTISADEPVDGAVRLRVRPAVPVGETLSYGDNSETTELTQIYVDAPWWDKLQHSTGLIVAALIAVAVSVTGLITAFKLDKLGALLWRRLIKGKGGSSPPTPPSTPTAGDPPAAGATTSTGPSSTSGAGA